ncbi:MAG: isocitrate lyase/PEP mutase family protein [Alphaproteobacteria bacterium]|nr:isocitrate lyase/PEP mutase family protein [Alphaproteobacteria bacterium]
MTIRDQLATGRVLAPGVWDALSALIAERAGFEAAFLSGSALAYAGLGRPDVALTTATEVTETAARIADRVELALFVDADSGFGNALNVQRLVRGLVRAGAAGVQIEDQTNFKPPSALQSRPLVAAAEMVGKIKAAQDARTSDAFLISARTDAPATEGLDGALRRGAAYVEAGCDLLFVEGLTTEAEIARIAAEFGGAVPLVHNLLDGGKSPVRAAAALPEAYRLVLFPGALLGAMTRAGTAAAAALMADGATTAIPLDDAGAVNRLVGTPEFLADAARYG